MTFLEVAKGVNEKGSIYTFFVFFIGTNCVRSSIHLHLNFPHSEIYHDIPADVAPLRTTMATSTNVSLVDYVFGKVQQGSVLSYHLPTRRPPVKPIHKHLLLSSRQLPIQHFRLGPFSSFFVYTEHQQTT